MARAAFAEQCAAAVQTLHDQGRAALRPLLPPGTPVALLDFPEYGNVGDSAIWLGALRLLEACGARVAYGASISSYDRDRLRRRIGPGGMVLLSGGGNFGDLWPAHQIFRERVIADCRELPVIQLPQSIHFQEPARLDQARAVLNAHPRLTLLLRDHASVALARATFSADVRLCPDAAFGLGSIPRPVAPARPVTVLSRNDKESRRDSAPGVERVDWVQEPADGLAWTGRALRRRPGGMAGTGLDLWWMRARAASRLRRGCRLLASGRVVVTNRLHGHILCVLMGQPHFASDTAQGKLGAFYHTWLEDKLPGLLCASEPEALAQAHALQASLATA